MSFFATYFGYVLKFLYDLVNNYGWAIILFSILVKLLMLPLTIKQQKALKKNAKLQEELKQIQFKYKNDPEKLNQEMMALYKREGASPFSGCFSSIIQLVLLLSVFILVSSPLTYMVKVDKPAIEEMKKIVISDENKNSTRYQEIAIIQYVKNLENGVSVEKNESEEQKSDEIVEKENEQKDNDVNSEKVDENKENKEENKFNIADYKDQVNLNMDFLGIDLSQVPTQNLKDWKTLIIPVLYVISSFISIKLTSVSDTKKKSDKKLITDGSEEAKEEDVNPMGDAGKTMTWLMPIMSVSIAIIAPLGLALYWLMNNVLMIVERVVLNKFLDKEEAGKDA